MDFRREVLKKPVALAGGAGGWGIGLPVADWGDVRAGIDQATDLQLKLGGRCLVSQSQMDEEATLGLPCPTSKTPSRDILYHLSFLLIPGMSAATKPEWHAKTVTPSRPVSLQA